MWVFDEGAPRFAGGVLLAVVRCFLFVVGLPFGVRLSEGEEDGLDIKNGFRWFSWDDVHETEKLHLRDFFDGSSITRTPKIYKEYRDFIISKYREDPSRRLTFSEVRKSLVGDIGLLHKVFLFLEKWGLINFGAPASEEDLGEEESQGRWRVRVEEGAPNGVRVVAVPNSLKPVTVPPSGSDNGGEVVENGFKLAPLASYRDVYSEQKETLCMNCKDRCESGHYECKKVSCFSHFVEFASMIFSNAYCDIR
ncbi:hypothetical protein TEA_017401 [Camellia sinensis var. sinensis]|uniref:SWIRM domain-containing protein n=1 Tax=Camellia sinensis var. sinensis TaxID=542762 RepID=A0A4S4EW75_CAMSN|nr:hypothetical protein TEA_017401 [Camellia sinensis var. sinensis]